MAPTLTVGLPVFNGAKFIEASVESILSQSFSDLKLIISDNASTDDTEAVSRSIAGRDFRVTYHRNAANIGIAANFNLLVPLARGRLFKWATADDLLRPGYLERCVSHLDADPSVVLAYARTEFVDENGSPLDLADQGWNLMSDDVSVRLSQAIRADHFVNAALGVIRTDALRRTHLVPRYSGGDYRMMAELSLLGKFLEIPEPLYVRRIHHGSTRATPATPVGCAATTEERDRAVAHRTGACAGTAPRSWYGRDSVVAEGDPPRAARPVDGPTRARLYGELTEFFRA